MKVNVRLSAGLAALTGNPRLQVTLADKATVADLLACLREQQPTLAPSLDSAIPMVAGRHAPRSELLVAGQEVALLLPVAGG